MKKGDGFGMGANARDYNAPLANADASETDVTQPAVLTTPPPSATARTSAVGRTPRLLTAPRRWPVVLIGTCKLFNSVGLVVVTFVLRALLSAPRHLAIVDWVDQMRLEPHNYLINSVLDLSEKATHIDHATLRMLHLGVIIYAGLYLIEGLGLLFDRKWAEWMVVVTTFGFLPFELFEICREITWGRCLLFTANIVVLAYLIFRLHRQAMIKRHNAVQRVP
jgi:uncharacterized membrane protein (DUF2068 family)